MAAPKKAPAKKAVTVIKKPVIKKNQSEENKKGINALKQAVGRKDFRKEPVTTPDPSKTTEPDITPDPNTATETVVVPDPSVTAEPYVTPDPNAVTEPVIDPNPVSEPKVTPLSIWGDIKRATEEDSKIKDPQEITSKAEDVAGDLNSAVNGWNDDDDANNKKQGNKVKAGIVIELVDVGFMLLCNLITWDFSDDNQKRYSLHADRKKALQSNLFNLYQLSDKKPNPKKDIVFLMLGSYSPMLIVAVITLIKNLKAKTAAKKMQKEVETQNAMIERQRKQLEIDRFKFEEEIKFRNEQIEHQQRLKSQPKATTRTPFEGVPKLGKQKAAPVKRSAGSGSRGVTPGTKRGPYKKKK